MDTPDITKFKGTQFTEKHFQIHYPEFYAFIIDKYKNENINFQEKLYWYYNNITERPRCACCGGEVKFRNATIGYQKYCSYKCLNSDPNKKEKVKNTCIERYGGVAPACGKEVQEKMCQTNIERYGVRDVMKNKDILNKAKQTILSRYGGFGNASEILKEKYRATNIDRYGVDNYGKTQECHDKMKKTCLEKYGFDHASKSEKIKNKISSSRRKTEISQKDYLIGYTPNGDWICKCPHEGCNVCEEKYFMINKGYFIGRTKDHTEICTRLLPIGADHTKNTTIELFIQSILDQNNIEYQSNVKGLMGDQKELDIYIPSKRMAIECNGVLSHCTRYKDRHYHELKTIKCKENNIQLIHLWEDWIRNKPDIVKSMVLSKLGLVSNKIFARNCIVEKCTDKKEYLEFMDNNHIQGRSGFEIGYGLRYEGKLVSIMTFGHKRGDTDVFELVRFCSVLNTTVVGAVGELFSHFIKDYNPSSVYSYASNDISNSDEYDKLGFVPSETINSSYWYIEPKTLKRYYKSTFTKKTADEYGYYRIYDSGQTKWVWYPKNNINV